MENGSDRLAEQDLCSVIDELTRSLASARVTIKSLQDKATATTELDTKDGISLLSMKHHLLLSYLQSLVLLSSRRALGHSLARRSPPKLPFSSSEREARGGGAGDLVDSMIEGRVVLEKIKALEGRMRYQIEKLVKVAEEAPANHNTIDDPLAFRPNPQNLMNDDENSGEDQDNNDDAGSVLKRDAIYRPPKLAPMPYTEPTSKKARRPHVPATLSSLLLNDPSMPHTESTTGLASIHSLSSNRAREVQRYNEFEEENFTRLVMKKKDAKRRKKDEEDIALGGSGGIQGRRRGGGLEDEFGDVLRSVGRGGGSRGGVTKDGYEELRKKGKKKDVLVRSRTRTMDEAFEGGDEGSARKKGRFEKEAKAAKKRLNKSRT